MNANNKGKENKNQPDGQRNRKRTRNDRRKAKEAAKTAAAAAAAVATAAVHSNNNSNSNKSDKNNKISIAFGASGRSTWHANQSTSSIGARQAVASINARNVKNAINGITASVQKNAMRRNVKEHSNKNNSISSSSKNNNNSKHNKRNSSSSGSNSNSNDTVSHQYRQQLDIKHSNGASLIGQIQQQQQEQQQLLLKQQQAQQQPPPHQQQQQLHEQNEAQSNETQSAGNFYEPQVPTRFQQFIQYGRHWGECSTPYMPPTWMNHWQMPEIHNITTTTQHSPQNWHCWPMRPQNHYADLMMQQPLLNDDNNNKYEASTAHNTNNKNNFNNHNNELEPDNDNDNDDDDGSASTALTPLLYAPAQTQSTAATSTAIAAPFNQHAAANCWSDIRKLCPLPQSVFYCSQLESEIFAQMANLARSFTPLGIQFNAAQQQQLQQHEQQQQHCHNSFAAQFEAALGAAAQQLTTGTNTNANSDGSSYPPPPPPSPYTLPEPFGSQFGSRYGESIPWELVLATMPRDLIDEMPSKLLLEMQLPRAVLPPPLGDTFVAMDCEMVGIGLDGQINMVARVSIVNQLGQVLLDKYVKPREIITDYRTAVSGIRPDDFLNADDFCAVQNWVQQILHNRILVGHNVATDLKVLNMFHPFSKIRDTSHYKPLAHYVSNGRTPSLKLLSHVVLGVEIQNGEHDSVEDARAAMGVYNRVADYWESSLSHIYAYTI